MATYDGRVTAYDVQKGDQVWAMSLGFKVDAALAASQHLLVACGTGGEIVALNCETVKPHYLWRKTLPAPVAGAPAIADGRVIVGAHDYSVRCFDLKRGDPLWTFRAEGPVASTPTVHEGRVFVGDDSGKLHAVSLADGGVLWTAKIGLPVRCGPAVDGDAIVVTTESDTQVGRFHVARIDQATGSVLWKKAFPGGNASSPATADGLIFISIDTALVALRSEDGSKEWSYVTGSEIRASPTVSGPFVYVGDDAGMMHCIDLRDGTRAWTFKSGGTIPAGPAVYSIRRGEGDQSATRLYFADNNRMLFCVAAEDNVSPDWSQFGGGPERGGYNRGSRTQH